MFFALPTIPQVTYDRNHNDDLKPLKLQLLRLLKQKMISWLPQGFPFHCGRDAYGRLSMSYASYEFQQTLNPAEHVTFKYIAPSPTPGSRMEWRIVATNRQSLRYTETMIAQVQVDPMVVQTRPFGLLLMIESPIIQEALAVALEIGVLITIEVANPKTYMYPCRRGIQLYPGQNQIVFRATDHRDRSEVVFVYQP